MSPLSRPKQSCARHRTAMPAAAGAIPCSNTFLAVLAVLAVLLARAVLKLVFLPFRILRGLFRRRPAAGGSPLTVAAATPERESRASSLGPLIRGPSLRPSFLVLMGLLLVACPHAGMAQGVQEAPAATVEVEEPRPGPPPPLPELSDPNAKAGEALNEPGERSGIPKALRSSGSRAGGPANELNPGGRAEAPAPPKGDLGRVVAGKELFHGNYCGRDSAARGCPRPTTSMPPACATMPATTRPGTVRALATRR